MKPRKQDIHKKKIDEIQKLFTYQMKLRNHLERLIPISPLYSKIEQRIEENQNEMVGLDEKLNKTKFIYMKEKVKFEVRTLSTLYRIVKVFAPQMMYPMNGEKPYMDSREERVLDIPISKDSDQYCKIICQALNQKYKTTKIKY